jgi:hypothetical protein
MLDGSEYGGARTHEPALVAAVAAAGPGPVLEIGAGYYSTPILHALCAAMGRALLTVDNDTGWIHRLESLRSSTHRLVSVDSWDQSLPLTDSEMWAVVFVDHAPAERRVVEIARLANRTEFMVVHDSEHPLYGYDRCFAEFKYRYDYTRFVPWTSILSNVRPFPAEL